MLRWGMSERLDVLKTYKLYINGQFPRSESGRSMPVTDAKGKVLAHVARASRKDLRDAVEAARKAQDSWAAATAYLRGQIMYRMAEMMEGKRGEFVAELRARERGSERSSDPTTAASWLPGLVRASAHGTERPRAPARARRS